MYCMAKGKDHKQYEYGDCLEEALEETNEVREKPPERGVCDRGYRGRKQIDNTQIILPGRGLKRDNRYQRDKKRKRCQRRAAIEPLIGHLKSDFRLSRNFLKGTPGDESNLLMAACAWNLRKWMLAFFLCFKKYRFIGAMRKLSDILLRIECHIDKYLPRPNTQFAHR